jgi:hypothetical protein
MDATKTCSRCGRAKPTDQFYKGSRRRCKDCVKDNTRAYRWRNSDKCRAWDRERGKRPERRARMKGWKPPPEKDAAHRAVKRALRSGALLRLPCETCGNPKTDAHHHRGYAPEHWLDVQWLCRIHHTAAHMALESF